MIRCSTMMPGMRSLARAPGVTNLPLELERAAVMFQQVTADPQLLKRPAELAVSKGQAVVGPHPEDLFNIFLTTVSTTILLFSSLFMVLGLAGVQRNDRKLGAFWLAMTLMDRGERAVASGSP